MFRSLSLAKAHHHFSLRSWSLSLDTICSVPAATSQILRTYPATILKSRKMSSYAHRFKNPPEGPGDGRPTALDIINGENLYKKLSDKVYLITGTSAGIGVETARALAATDARLFLAVRNVEKGKEACKDFLEPGRVEVLECDTSSMKSVRACAEAVLAKTHRLNGLICNAGIMMTPTRVVTEDGFEGQLATNYLGHFLLFWLLKDALLNGSFPGHTSRVVSVASSGHHASEINFDNLQLEGEGVYKPSPAYGQSKLAQIYMTNRIEREYGPQGIHALSLNPGGIATNLQKHMPKALTDRFATDPNIVRYMKSPEQGAATTVYAAVSKDWEGKGGKYLEDCDVSPPAKPEETGVRGVKDYAYDKEKEDRLWEMTLEILGLKG